MKKDILKIAGVKSEKDFYYLYPTEEAFKRAFPKEFSKAKMGASMVKKQATQLIDFSNPPQAQGGWHSEWNDEPTYNEREIDIQNRSAEQKPKAPSKPASKANVNVSVVDFMNNKGLKSDFNTRKGLAQQYGIKDYKGTAEQNMQLMSNLKGKSSAPKKADVSNRTETPKKAEAAPAKTAAPTQTKPKLSKAEEWIAKDPYFFAEESDPNWIKAIDAPFTGIRNLGAKVVYDQDPMAFLKLLGMGAMSNAVIGQSKLLPYNSMQIPEVVGASRAASRAIPYATRALPGFQMGGYIPQAQSGFHSEWGDNESYDAEGNYYPGDNAQRYMDALSDSNNPDHLEALDAANRDNYPMATPSINVANTPQSASKSLPSKKGQSSGSIVDYLNSTGKKSDFATRKALAESRGIKGYTGTAEQNTRLLSTLKGKTAPSQKSTSQKKEEPTSIFSNDNAKKAYLNAHPGMTEAEYNQRNSRGSNNAEVRSSNTGPSNRAVQGKYDDRYFSKGITPLNTDNSNQAAFSDAVLNFFGDTVPSAVLAGAGPGIANAAIRGLAGTSKYFPHGLRAIPEVVAKSRDASRAIPYANRALPGFEMGGYTGQVPKYQNSGKPLIGMPSTGQLAQSDYDITNQFNQSNPGANINAGANPNYGQQKPQQPQQQSLATTAGGKLLDKGVGMLGPIGKPIGQVVNAGRKIKQSIDQAAQARQSGALGSLALQASSMRPEQTKRKYTRPEDALVQPNQLSPSYGTGSDVLGSAQYGANIGGNPTELQNMYNPGDMYMDLGYEPLDDSNQAKQYRAGGVLRMAMGGFNIPTNPTFDAIGKGADIGGDVISGLIDMGTEKRMAQNQQMLGQTAFQSASQGMQNQNAAFMEDGGWVSHDWQPQVITQFGGYNVKDLLRDDPTMDTLRSGGHLKNYTPPSAQAMSTERPEFAMGGQLKTTWGGYAEPISHNPYLPGSGETVMFRGKSHEESDGNGHTGIGVKYGQGAHDNYTDYAQYGTEQADADVEVERGEPATELMDSATGETNMVVYGDMKIPSYALSELRDPLAKGKKFKNYANDLSKIEKRQNNLLEKSINRLNDLDPTTPFEKLEFETLSTVVNGANMKLKGLAAQKEMLAGIQNAILDTSKEYGVQSAELAKGKIQQDPESQMAKFGGKFSQAQLGIHQPLSKILPMSTYHRIDPRTDFKMQTTPEVRKQVEQQPQPKPAEKKTVNRGKAPAKKVAQAPSRTKPITSIDIPRRSAADMDITPNITAMVPEYAKNMTANEQLTPRKSDLMDLWKEIQPYTIPSNQEAFDAGQITPEMMALATNQLDPVQAQQYTPQLETPYSVSFQDQINANQADFNALQRQMGYNPAAASQLAAQKYAANSGVLGQQFRTNQEMQMGAYNRNRGVLNDSTLKNLSLLDQQYQRQSQAKSATKAQAQSAIGSIADKIAKHKLENKTLGVYENMYNYRFGPNGKAINVNAPHEFNLDVASMTPDDIETAKKWKALQENKGIKSQKTGRNGSLVKLFK